MSTSPYRWDLELFQAIHPVTAPPHFLWVLARTLADGPLVLTTGLLVLLIGLPRLSMRRAACGAAVAALAALTVSGLIGLVWNRPRPFMAGVGQAWMAHAATGSFPSNHLTLQWTVAGVLMLAPPTRPWGYLIALLGLPMAWARIYLGVHYPGDMLGALLMAGWMVLTARVIDRRWKLLS